MPPARHLISRHPRWMTALLAIVLAAKMLLPTGYMPTVAGDTILVSICSGSGSRTMVMALPGDAGETQSLPGDDAAPCSFAGTMLAGLAAADPVVLAAALLVALALAFRGAPDPAPLDRPFLRPPLRGPPMPAGPRRD